MDYYQALAECKRIESHYNYHAPAEDPYKRIAYKDTDAKRTVTETIVVDENHSFVIDIVI